MGVLAERVQFLPLVDDEQEPISTRLPFYQAGDEVSKPNAFLAAGTQVLGELDIGGLLALRRAELASKNRKTVLAAIERELQHQRELPEDGIEVQPQA